MDPVTSEVIPKIMEWGGIVTTLIFVIGGLTWFIKHLIRRNIELSDKFADVVEKNTQAFVELREAIRNAK